MTATVSELNPQSRTAPTVVLGVTDEMKIAHEEIFGPILPGVRLPTYSVDRLSECERERFNSGIEKLDLKQALVDGSWLPNELIETLLGHRAVASVIDVCASSYTCGLSIDDHPETHGRPSRGWSENEVQITRVKSVRDPAAGNVQDRGFCLDRPFAAQGH